MTEADEIDQREEDTIVMALVEQKSSRRGLLIRTIMEEGLVRMRVGTKYWGENLDSAMATHLLSKAA